MSKFKTYMTTTENVARWQIVLAAVALVVAIVN